MTETEADLVLKVSPAIHGERLWRRVGTRDHMTGDGRTIVLALWQSMCVICGDPFEITLSSSILSVDRSNSFLATTCPAHRMTPLEASKLGRTKAADRPVVFEAIRQWKLAADAQAPQPVKG